MEIVKAQDKDLSQILDIYSQARTFMADNGNPTQWGDSYPPLKTLVNDIREGKLYLCVQDGVIGAVFFFDIWDDPTYRKIYDGEWINDEPYGVVHRLASSHRFAGCASNCINSAFDWCGNLRIDTHENNVPMRSLLTKLGFQMCGTIYISEGKKGKRIAFQKIRHEKSPLL